MYKGPWVVRAGKKSLLYWVAWLYKTSGIWIGFRLMNDFFRQRNAKDFWIPIALKRVTHSDYSRCLKLPLDYQ